MMNSSTLTRQHGTRLPKEHRSIAHHRSHSSRRSVCRAAGIYDTLSPTRIHHHTHHSSSTSTTILTDLNQADKPQHKPENINRRHLITLTAITSTLLPLVSYASEPTPTPRQLTPQESDALEKAFSKTLSKGKAPVMLRLVFHDAATYDQSSNNGGINASIRLELERPENYGLKRGYKVIENTIDALKGTAAEGLSSADLIALAGAYAVRITGGPDIRNIPVGRKDAQREDPEGRLPGETLSAVEQLKLFGSKGLTAQEMVALLGSHTLGSKGFGDPLTFDNTYYITLLQKPWLKMNDEMANMIGLPTDHVLPDDPTCRPLIELYAKNKELFYDDFAKAYVKMTMLGAEFA